MALRLDELIRRQSAQARQLRSAGRWLFLALAAGLVSLGSFCYLYLRFFWRRA